jgi:hypothetical protein
MTDDQSAILGVIIGILATAIAASSRAVDQPDAARLGELLCGRALQRVLQLHQRAPIDPHNIRVRMVTPSTPQPAPIA